MLDFTLQAYCKLIDALKSRGYRFLTFGELMEAGGDAEEPWVVLRHDVDKRPYSAVVVAREEAKRELAASYYFRAVPRAWDETVIREIASLNHECGYHYEDLTLAGGDLEEARRLFIENLERLRKIVPVSTICMHGSPMSRYDNRDIWRRYDYKESGIIGEPYFDVDYNKVFYITDTGRSWNSGSGNVRDKVKGNLNFSVKTTRCIIEKIKNGTFPNKAIINTHPHRWQGNAILWTGELLSQNIKNLVKRAVILRREMNAEAR